MLIRIANNKKDSWIWRDEVSIIISKNNFRLDLNDYIWTSYNFITLLFAKCDYIWSPIIFDNNKFSPVQQSIVAIHQITTMSMSKVCWIGFSTSELLYLFLRLKKWKLRKTLQLSKVPWWKRNNLWNRKYSWYFLLLILPL